MLGPLLFLIHMNDLLELNSSTKILALADDIVVLQKGKVLQSPLLPYTRKRLSLSPELLVGWSATVWCST